MLIEFYRLKISANSLKGTALFTNEYVPFSLISRAALKNSPNEARINVEPRLILLTPISANSGTVKEAPIITFTGLFTERTTEVISSRLLKSGAYNTSAPAS